MYSTDRVQSVDRSHGQRKHLGGAARLLPERVRHFATVAAGNNLPVLIEGETGVGKTSLARLIHELAPCHDRPLIRVNCGAIPKELFEREMFGHVRGAFTDAKESREGLFEAADGGSLFLDEIGELPLQVQPKLLAVVEDGRVRRVGAIRETRVRVRIIAATNANLLQRVQEKRFRADLYHRLALLKCRIPPLRKRRAELEGIIEFLLQSKKLTERVPQISPAALELLHRYPWPGNIRELDNSLRYAAAFSGGSRIEPHHLPNEIRSGTNGSTAPTSDNGGMPTTRYTAPEDPEVEREHILKALRLENGNKTRAANRLGMSRSTLWIKLTRLGLNDPPAESM